MEKFFTNEGDNTLIKRLEGLLERNPSIKYFDSVVGFLRASGYFSLRPFFDGVNKVRILVGIDVDKYVAKANNWGQIYFGASEEGKKDYKIELKKDIESANYSVEVEHGIAQMMEDIATGKLELRVCTERNIHAKIYILYPEAYDECSFGAAITGSSNLSGNGLGTSKERQYEFDVQLSDYSEVSFARQEFEKLWDNAQQGEINAEDVKEVINTTYLKDDVSPYDLYVKMLMEYFSDRVLQLDADDTFDMPEGYARFEYQMDAVVEGYQKLIRYDGFFLADVVGLGKTVIATMIAKRFCIENGYENTKILVVYPPAVEQNWMSTFHDFGIDRYAKFVSNGSLAKILDEENNRYWNADEYDLVILDEAHKFRTHTNTAFVQLQEICKMPRVNTGNIAGYKKKVMLISATPMNNTPVDIYNEMLLFQDPRCCTIDGVPNLTSFFAPLDKEFKRLRRENDYNLNEFRKLAEKVRDRVIKPITVRRTRTDIESVERYAKDVNKFPKVLPPIKNEYVMNDHIADLFESAMQTLVKDLSYARYQAIAFLKPEKSKDLYDNAEVVSHSLANIRRNGLVKRLESSFYAFKKSLENFRDANQNMIKMFENNRVFIAPDLDINGLYDLGLTDDEIEEKLNQKAVDNPKNKVFSANDFDPQFLGMLRADQLLIESMCNNWANVTDKDDSKFDKFSDILQHDLFKKSKNPGQKLVIFSESLDTVEYLNERIGRSDVLIVSSANRNKLFKTICENFDANYKTKKNDFNIIITTDVLSEGVNLHRSNIIVNYDTPWNSTKLMQRIGRVNRIGTESPNIYNYVFYPSRQGNDIIRLNQIALSKIQSFHTTFGEDNKIYSKDEIIDNDIDKLFDEAASESVEEWNEEVPFYEELRSLYLTNRREYNRISRLSLRSRTGRMAREVEGVTLNNDTLVFLKTNMRSAFYRSSEESVAELSVIDALKYFKANVDEKPVERISSHHDHVQKALKCFYISKQQEQSDALVPNIQTSSSLGSQVNSAVNILNDFLRKTTDKEEQQQIIQLRQLAERGVITQIAKRLQRMKKELSNGSLMVDDAWNEIRAMAQRYNVYYRTEEEMKRKEESPANIILSESFN